MFVVSSQIHVKVIMIAFTIDNDWYNIFSGVSRHTFYLYNTIELRD